MSLSYKSYKSYKYVFVQLFMNTHFRLYFVYEICLNDKLESFQTTRQHINDFLGGIALGWSTDGGLKIPWSAPALLGKFSNLRLGVYTSFAHEKRINLHIYFFHHYFYKSNYFNRIRGLNFCTIRAKHVGVIPSSETANTRPEKLNGVKKLSTQEKEMLFSTRVFVFIVRK